MTIYPHNFPLLSRSNTMDLYLAARYSRKKEMMIHRDTLRRIGHNVLSSWLDTEKRVAESAFSTKCRQLANRQSKKYFGELVLCDACVLFTEQPRTTNSRGGRFVEFGITMGLMKRLFVVGPDENIFCLLEDVRRFPDINGLIEFIGWGQRDTLPA